MPTYRPGAFQGPRREPARGTLPDMRMPELDGGKLDSPQLSEFRPWETASQRAFGTPNQDAGEPLGYGALNTPAPEPHHEFFNQMSTPPPDIEPGGDLSYAWDPWFDPMTDRDPPGDRNSPSESGVEDMDGPWTDLRRGEGGYGPAEPTPPPGGPPDRPAEPTPPPGGPPDRDDWEDGLDRGQGGTFLDPILGGQYRHGNEMDAYRPGYQGNWDHAGRPMDQASAQLQNLRYMATEGINSRTGQRIPQEEQAKILAYLIEGGWTPQ